MPLGEEILTDLYISYIYIILLPTIQRSNHQSATTDMFFLLVSASARLWPIRLPCPAPLYGHGILREHEFPTFV